MFLHYFVGSPATQSVVKPTNLTTLFKLHHFKRPQPVPVFNPFWNPPKRNFLTVIQHQPQQLAVARSDVV